MSNSKHISRLNFITLLILGLLLNLSNAQPKNNANNEDKAKPAVNVQVPKEFSSPLETMSYLIKHINNGDRKKAAECFDLSGLTDDTKSRAGDAAYWLKYAIDRIAFVNEDYFADHQPPNKWNLENKSGFEISIAKSENGRWLFTKQTLNNIPDLRRFYDDYDPITGVEDISGAMNYPEWIRHNLPSWMKRQTLVLEVWQWFGLLLVIIIGFIVQAIAIWFLTHISDRWLNKFKIRVDDKQKSLMLKALGVLIVAGFWYLGVHWLDLPPSAYGTVMFISKFVACIFSVIAVYRLVDVLASYLELKTAKTASKFDDLLVPLFRKSLKILVVAFGMLFIAQNLNLKVWSLLTGLGIGGLALGFAAKDTIANFFGSVMILTDRPFNIGDWIIIGDKEGSIEELGFRSTRIRTFYNSVVYVPNADMANARIDNMGERKYRRFKTLLNLTYDTPPEKIQKFCEAIRQLVLDRPSMRHDYFHVYLNQFGPHSLDILLYVFFEVPDWSIELKERHAFMLDIIKLASDMQVEFAFPTQTLHMFDENKTDGLPDNPEPA